MKISIRCSLVAWFSTLASCASVVDQPNPIKDASSDRPQAPAGMDAGESSSSSSGSSSGAAETPPQVDPCSDRANQLGAKYVDLTADAADRSVVWDLNAFDFAPNRCVKIKKGQSFVLNWNGKEDLNNYHILIAKSSPSLLDGAVITKEKITITFKAAGTYAYTCRPHSGMSGVVWVVE
jgi:plastocyanin